MKSYLEIRDGRREGPVEKETTSLILSILTLVGLWPPALSPLPLRKVILMPNSGPEIRDGSQWLFLLSGIHDVTHGHTLQVLCHLLEVTCSAQLHLLAAPDAYPPTSLPFLQPPSAPTIPGPTFGLLLFPADQAGHQGAKSY